jgi:hypothetical protein
MTIEPTQPTVKNPPEQFAGDVWPDIIASPHEAGQWMTVATVRFASGAGKGITDAEYAGPVTAAVTGSRSTR